MSRLKIFHALALAIAIGLAGEAVGQVEANSEVVTISRKLASTMLGKVNVENRPLSEVIAAIGKQVNATGAALDFVTDLKPTGADPLVSCCLTRENAETAIEFITRSVGFDWTIADGKVRIFTSDYHRALHLRGRELPERQALRTLRLKDLEFKDQSAEAIFLSLGTLVKNEEVLKAVPALRGHTFVFLPSDRDLKRPQISIKFDGCTLDDALELLTIRLPEFQWTADHNTIKAYYHQ